MSEFEMLRGGLILEFRNLNSRIGYFAGPQYAPPSLEKGVGRMRWTLLGMIIWAVTGCLAPVRERTRVEGGTDAAVAVPDAGIAALDAGRPPDAGVNSVDAGWDRPDAGRCHDLDCDDLNACTTDSCDDAVGCSHALVTCPAAADACRSPRCDVKTGCGFTNVGDGTSCGPTGCWVADVRTCASGACASVPKPSDAVCRNIWLPGYVPAVYSSALAPDPVRKRVVLFGGTIDARVPERALSDQTWEWDGERWEQRLPPSAPSARSNHAMAWDGDHNRIVLFGGISDSGALNDTWELDGITWSKRTPLTVPPAVQNPTLGWDPSRHRIVLFGVLDTGPVTWEWDGIDWHDGHPASSPNGWYAPKLVYDEERHELVLVGKVDSVRNVWDGTAWLEHALSTPLEYCNYQAAVWDHVRKQIVAFCDAGSAVWTWALEGDDWVRIQQDSPPPRISYAASWDPVHNWILFYGGNGGYGPWPTVANDTWEFNGSGWVPFAKVSHPPEVARGAFALASDLARKRVVLTMTTQKIDNMAHTHSSLDVWEWDGLAWEQQTPKVDPPGGWGHGLVFDPVRNNIVLRAMAIEGATWTWDGADWGAWPTTDPGPQCFSEFSNRHQCVMGWDPGSKRVIFLSATPDGSETWEWDGAVWRQLMPITSPPPRVGVAIGQDGTQLIIFGGADLMTGVLSDETWAWAGGNWVLLNPSTKPPQHLYGQLVWDPVRKRTILFGGRSGGGNGTALARELWEWDGQDWFERTPLNMPAVIDGTDLQMAWNPQTEHVFLYSRTSVWEYAPP